MINIIDIFLILASCLSCTRHMQIFRRY